MMPAAPTRLDDWVRARRTALTGEIELPKYDRPAVRPALEPIFAAMVNDYGCPLVGVPWTGRRPVEGRVVDGDAGPMLVTVP